MTSKGITLDCLDKSNEVSSIRLHHVNKLIDWLSELGFMSKDVKLVIGKSGDVRCYSKKYIPSDTNIFLSPLSYRLTFSTLRHEVLSARQNTILNEFTTKIKKFENDFPWNSNNYLKKDCFSNILPFVITVFSTLKKISKSITGNNGTIEGLSPILKTFHLYWNTLPLDIKSFLFDWTEEEYNYLKNTSLYKCIDDTKRFGISIYEELFKPFSLENIDMLGEESIELKDFIRICTIISSRTFNVDNENNQEFIPVIDSVSGKPNSKHNCELDRICLNGNIMRTIRTIAPVYAGEEIYIQYPACSNSDYLITYNHLPLDREIILNNPLSEISICMSDFFDAMLLYIHPESKQLREAKKAYISEITGVPHHLVICTDDLNNKNLNISQSMRQVLIFLHSDEEILRKTLDTKKLKYKVSSHIIFQSLCYLIESQFGKPNISLFYQLLNSVNNSNNSNHNSINGSSNNNSSSNHTTSSINSVKPNSSTIDGKDLKNLNGTTTTTTANGITNGKVVFGIQKDAKTNELILSNNVTSNHNAILSISFAITPPAQTATVKDAKSTVKDATATVKDIPSLNTPNTANAINGSNNNNTTADNIVQLTDNMKSAIYLQISERIVIENFINSFIELFDELQFPSALAVLGNHMVQDEITNIITELERPYQIARSQVCMMCGCTEGIVRCSRCHQAYYCGTICQQNHWHNNHKKTCKKIMPPIVLATIS